MANVLASTLRQALRDELSLETWLSRPDHGAFETPRRDGCPCTFNCQSASLYIDEIYAATLGYHTRFQFARLS